MSTFSVDVDAVTSMVAKLGEIETSLADIAADLSVILVDNQTAITGNSPLVAKVDGHVDAAISYLSGPSSVCVSKAKSDLTKILNLFADLNAS